MDRRVQQGFEAGVKIALSAGTMASFLRQRAAQGARVAPGLLQRAEGLAPGALRGAALNAGADVRAANQVHAMAPAKAGLQARIAATPETFSAKPLTTHDAFNNTHQYSQSYMNSIANPNAQIHSMTSAGQVVPGVAPNMLGKALPPAAAPAGATVPRGRRPLASAATVPAARVPGRASGMGATVIA